MRGQVPALKVGQMRRWVLFHVAIFLLALAVRLSLAAAFVGLSAPAKGAANPDQLDYELLAHHVSSGAGFALTPGEPSACRPPGTPFILVPVYAVFGHSYLAARIWFCLLSAACCPVAGWLAQRLVSPAGGVLAAAWLAVYPGHAYYAMHFLSETPTTLLTALAIALHVGRRGQPAGLSDVLTGLVWGLAILVRPNLAVAAGLALLLVVVDSTAAWRSRLWKAALIAAPAALVVGPWVIRNAVVMGKPGVCTIVGGYTFWGAYNARVADTPKLRGYWVAASAMIDADHPLTGTEVEREKKAWEYGWTFVRARPDSLPAMKLHALLRVVWAYEEADNRTVDRAFRLSWISSLPFVLIGLVRLARRTPWETLYLLTPLMVVLVTVAMFYGCSRFRDAAAPILAVFAAAGVVSVSELLLRKRGPTASKQ
jgi:4-amino-4-deoxy-L-arabinose transferase-like glycosyltransferase